MKQLYTDELSDLRRLNAELRAANQHLRRVATAERQRAATLAKQLESAYKFAVSVRSRPPQFGGIDRS